MIVTNIVCDHCKKKKSNKEATNWRCIKVNCILPENTGTGDVIVFRHTEGEYIFHICSKKCLKKHLQKWAEEYIWNS